MTFPTTTCNSSRMKMLPSSFFIMVVTVMVVVVDMLLSTSTTPPSSTTVTMAFVPKVQPRSATMVSMATQSRVRNVTVLAAAGRGFGKQGSSSSNNNSNNSKDGSNRQYRKSYDKDATRPVQGLLDIESAMGEFFSSREDWHPLFRSLAADTNVPAMTFLEKTLAVGDDGDGDFEFHENTSPWKRLQAIPTGDDEREVLAKFLDAMQQSLVDIPVDETTKEDENDLHFIEEGRRMLVCSRFHVIQDMDQRTVDSYDSLFRACWNEIAELTLTDEIDTGSLIVVPDLDYDELRQFADINLQRPLQWLGMNDIFEVAIVERGGLGVVRLIHKLSEIPIPEGASDQNGR